MLGQVLLDVDFDTKNEYKEFSLAHLESGVYFFEFQVDDKSFFKELVVE